MVRRWAVRLRWQSPARRYVRFRYPPVIDLMTGG